jgi:hypothetical protein
MGIEVNAGGSRLLPPPLYRSAHFSTPERRYRCISSSACPVALTGEELNQLYQAIQAFAETFRVGP